MEGGLRAWDGIKAEGFPEPNLVYFSAAHSLEEYVALACILEEGTGSFYNAVTEIIDMPQAAKDLFSGLASAEVRHKSKLIEAYGELSDEPADTASLSGMLPEGSHGDLMEGWVRVGEALRWTGGKTAGEILDYAIALEAIAYDRYIVMIRKTEDARVRNIFESLCAEEKQHLQRMADLAGKLP